MGAKPKKTGTAARVPAKQKRTPARRVPARRAASSAAHGSVDGYVAGLSGDVAEIAERLRHLVMGAAPSAVESIKWGQPVYEDNGPFCYFKAGAGHITFGFWRGTELEDPDERLESGDDRMKHVVLRSVEDIDDGMVGRWVRQAVDLNWRLGSPTRLASQETEAAAAVALPDEPVGDEGGDDVQVGSRAETKAWSPATRSGDDIEVDVDLDLEEEDGDARFGDGARDGETTQPIETVVDDDSFEPAWKDGER
ncbi:MAG TPA: DUF1801 domain-containing protein [Kofleriaceae bacterium]|nr:DUF1801 domain-containing protein [Kofleriaceae bacterium]